MLRSGTTYMRAPLLDGDVIASAQSTKAEAASRLGSEDGLSIVSCHEAHDNTVAVTWRRVWDEQEPAPGSAIEEVPAAEVAQEVEADQQAV